MNNDKTTVAEPTASTGQKPSAAQPESLIFPADTGTIQAASDTSAHTADTSHDPAEQPQPVLPENLGEPAHTKKRPGGFFKKLGIFLLILMLLMLLPAAALIGYVLIDRANPAGHIPDGYYALVSVTSASDTLQKGLYLSAVSRNRRAAEQSAGIARKYCAAIRLVYVAVGHPDLRSRIRTPRRGADCGYRHPRCRSPAVAACHGS